MINKNVLDDVTCFSSSERRVLATANVFLEAFLDVDQVPEGFIQISKDMLDDSNAAKEQMDRVKVRLLEILNTRNTADLPARYHLPDSIALPYDLVQEVVELLRSRRQIMRNKFEELNVEEIQKEWCCSESPALFRERWERLFREFCDVRGLDGR